MTWPWGEDWTWEDRKPVPDEVPPEVMQRALEAIDAAYAANALMEDDPDDPLAQAAAMCAVEEIDRVKALMLEWYIPEDDDD